MSGWLCEPEEAAHESWMSDAYWVKANERNGHRTLIRTPQGVQHVYDQMGFVRCSQLRETLFYGSDDPFFGFSPRYSTNDPARAQNAICVIDAQAQGKGGLCSVWLVGWGPRSVFMVTPDGEPPVHAGEIGLAVANFRFVIRIANVGHADVDYEALERLMLRARTMFPVSRLDHEKVRPVYYVSRALKEHLNDHLRGILIRAMPLRWNEARIGADAEAA